MLNKKYDFECSKDTSSNSNGREKKFSWKNNLKGDTSFILFLCAAVTVCVRDYEWNKDFHVSLLVSFKCNLNEFWRCLICLRRLFSRGFFCYCGLFNFLFLSCDFLCAKKIQCWIRARSTQWAITHTHRRTQHGQHEKRIIFLRFVFCCCFFCCIHLSVSIVINIMLIFIGDQRTKINARFLCKGKKNGSDIWLNLVNFNK